MACPGKTGAVLSGLLLQFHYSVCQIVAKKRAREESRIPAWGLRKSNKYCLADFSIENTQD